MMPLMDRLATHEAGLECTRQTCAPARRKPRWTRRGDASGAWHKVTYTAFKKYAAHRANCPADVRYKWLKDSHGKKYRFAQRVWADKFAE